MTKREGLEFTHTFCVASEIPVILKVPKVGDTTVHSTCMADLAMPCVHFTPKTIRRYAYECLMISTIVGFFFKRRIFNVFRLCCATHVGLWM